MANIKKRDHRYELEIVWFSYETLKETNHLGLEIKEGIKKGDIKSFDDVVINTGISYIPIKITTEIVYDWLLTIGTIQMIHDLGINGTVDQVASLYRTAQVGMRTIINEYLKNHGLATDEDVGRIAPEVLIHSTSYNRFYDILGMAYRQCNL